MEFIVIESRARLILVNLMHCPNPFSFGYVQSVVGIPRLLV
jgi:hypothetical protein